MPFSGFPIVPCPPASTHATALCTSTTVNVGVFTAPLTVPAASSGALVSAASLNVVNLSAGTPAGVGQQVLMMIPILDPVGQTTFNVRPSGLVTVYTSGAVLSASTTAVSGIALLYTPTGGVPSILAMAVVSSSGLVSFPQSGPFTVSGPGTITIMGTTTAATPVVLSGGPIAVTAVFHQTLSCGGTC